MNKLLFNLIDQYDLHVLCHIFFPLLYLSFEIALLLHLSLLLFIYPFY